jgi:hypothetical protein
MNLYFYKHEDYYLYSIVDKDLKPLVNLAITKDLTELINCYNLSKID